MGRKLLMGVLGLISVLYLINPTAGVFELLPDNLPLIGNLDEALATALLIAVLREFGIDVSRWFGTRKPPESPPVKDVTRR